MIYNEIVCDEYVKWLASAASLVLLLVVLSAVSGDVMAKEIKLSTSETKENTFLNFSVPVPILGDFNFYVKMKTETQGNLNIDLSVDKQMISPNEELEIYVKPISGKLTVNRTMVIEVIDPKGNVHRKELPSITETKNIPGKFSISVPLPISDVLKTAIGYLAGGGIGGAISSAISIPSIGANVNGEIKTYPKLYLKSEGRYPDLTEIVLYSTNPVTVRVKKTEGVGAKITLDSWNLDSTIYLSSEIYGGEYKGNVSPVTYKLIDRKEKVNAVIATLKTPIRIKLNEIKERRENAYKWNRISTISCLFKDFMR